MKEFNPLQYEIDREFPPEYTEPEFEVADIFKKYGEDYRKNHVILGPQLDAMKAIEKCRTTALGAHVDHCDECGHNEISYNSCRNRHCPKCRASQRVAWIAERELELLPIQYFHVVMTLPQPLLPLVRYNPDTLYDLLFHSAAGTLQDFAESRWDGKLGITMVLHTWGQTLNDHPHVHCIVTGGALKNDHSEFVRAPKNFLFPVKALSRVFRGKFLDGLQRLHRKDKLNLSGQQQLTQAADWNAFIQRLHRQEWVVYAKQPFDSPEYLIRYLGRYVNRIAIANHRIQSIDEGVIRFNYHDNRDGEDKTMSLSADTFIGRFLNHVLPRQFRRIRYFGFLVNAQRKEKLALCRKLLGLDPDVPFIPDMDAYLTEQGYNPRGCPICAQGILRSIFQVLSFHDPPDCLLAEAIQ